MKPQVYLRKLDKYIKASFLGKPSLIKEIGGLIRLYLEKRVNINKVVLLAILISFLTVGCQNPAKKPEKKQAKLKEEPTISLYHHETGKKEEIKIEKYLEGVVAAEMESNWHPEALAAQAILARTFTMKKISEGGVKARGTDASTDIEEFQAYDASRVNDKVKEAVARTRGEVVTHQGNYINGWFHADSGGKTAASSAEGLEFKKEPTPYIKSVDDPGHKITTPENKSWTATFSAAEVQQAVEKTLGKNSGNITSIAIAKKGPSGRTISIKINDTTLSGPALRLALGSEKMRSTFLENVQLVEDKVTFKGKGFGHGVGMSQWGARALAEDGRKAEEIVSYFFKDVKIEKRWD